MVNANQKDDDLAQGSERRKSIMELIIPEILNHLPKLKAEELKRQVKQKETRKLFLLKQQRLEQERKQDLENLFAIIKKAKGR